MAAKTRRQREAPLDRLGREAFINLYLASRRFTDQVEKLCRDENIAMSHYTVLWFLSHRDVPEGVPMGTVIDGHLNRASDSTRLADRLTDLGYIERLASPTDRRVVLIRLTDAGRDVVARLTDRIQELHREQWSFLDPEELDQLNRLLAKVLWGEESLSGRKHPLIAESRSTN